MDVELEPEQPVEVALAIRAELAPHGPAQPDPWWQAGTDEALDA